MTTRPTLRQLQRWLGALPVGPTRARRLYLVIARAAAQLLGRLGCVRSVYLRRSVAVGEVDFAYSDIDLAVVAENLAGTHRREILALSRVVRLLRRAVPVIGECLVFDQSDLDEWSTTDAYRASIDQRTCITLYGPAPAIAFPGLRRDHAVRRFAFWFEGYLADAVRGQDRRNLRKLLLELCNAYLTAVGEIDLPLATRAETERTWLMLGRRLPADGAQAFRLALALAGELHQRLRPPLRPPRQPLVISRVLPPWFARRTVVVLPGVDAPLPPQAAAPDSLVCTPEVLDLYLSYVNAFADAALPEVRALGISPPTPAAFVRSARFYGSVHRLRSPGLIRRQIAAALAEAQGVISSLRHVVESDGSPEALGRPLEAAIPRPRLAGCLSCDTYYRDLYTDLHRQATAYWPTLDHLVETEPLPAPG